MPRHGPGPVCAWTKDDGSRCAKPVTREGLHCHKHEPLVSREQLREVARRHSREDAIAFEAKYTRNRLASTALQYGLDAPETKAAYDAMVVANGPNPPVPDAWSKPPPE